MKKILFLLLATLFVLPSMADKKKEKDTFVAFTNATITFRDGHEETYDLVGFPASFSETIHVREEIKGKNVLSIPAEDIRYITYWASDFPDKKSTIYCLREQAKKKKKKDTIVWGIPHMGSQWGIVFRCFFGYRISATTGKLHTYSLLDESTFVQLAKPGLTLDEGLMLLRRDSEYAVLLAWVREYTDRKTDQKVYEYVWPAKKAKNVAKYFSENQEIYQQILDGTLKASDMQYILDQM